MPQARPARARAPEDICNCGRFTVTAKGDLEATCPACHSLPDYCEGEPPRPPSAVPGGDPGATAAQILPGGCILDEPETPPALWGDGDAILWAEGESLIIAGPDGTGKTTLAGHLVRARLGIGDENVLGMPVAPGKRNTLYLAMDRPRQARRSLRRLFTTADRDVLDGKLRLWQGPPPPGPARPPRMLATPPH